jgi:hypothetical protein
LFNVTRLRVLPSRNELLNDLIARSSLRFSCRPRHGCNIETAIGASNQPLLLSKKGSRGCPHQARARRSKNISSTRLDNLPPFPYSQQTTSPEGRARPCEPGVGDDGEAGPAVTRGRCLNGQRWWPARDTPVWVGRWLQGPFADGRRGGQGALQIDPALCREKRHVNAVDGCGRQRAISSSVLATKHRARVVWALGPASS